MGNSRPRPTRLAEKLLLIRTKINGGLSQTQMALLIGLDAEDRERISKYERGVLEPPLATLCNYAEAANVWMDVLVKDDFNLPDNLPAKVKSEGIKADKI
jgi:transcriptional regulator with XRE-family HTH domain